MPKRNVVRSRLVNQLRVIFLVVALVGWHVGCREPNAGGRTGSASDEKIFSLVCYGRKPCEIIKQQDAGSDEMGNRLKVVTISLRSKNQQTEQTDCLGEQEPLEYWLIVDDGTQVVLHQLLLRICNDGYGAAGAGEDQVTVGNNWFEHIQSGGSNWRGTTKVRLQLSPLRKVHEEANGFWTLGSNAEAVSWSWEGFNGFKRWKCPVCGPDGEPIEDDTMEYVYNFIPKVMVSKAFSEREWKTTELGKCCVPVTGAGDRGYTIYGKPGNPDDASMKVLLSANDELFVEVFDDRWTGPGKKWITDDHFELWLGGQLPSYSEPCIRTERLTKPRQWGIRIADGKVFPAYGNPTDKLALEHSSASSKKPVRFKIKLPPDVGSLTVIYSDSDDGRTQERLISTSKLIYGSPLTLGESKEVKSDEVTCVVQNGLLQPQQTLRQFEPLKPVLEH